MAILNNFDIRTVRVLKTQRRLNCVVGTTSPVAEREVVIARATKAKKVKMLAGCSADASEYYSDGYRKMIGGVPCKVASRKQSDGTYRRRPNWTPKY